MECEDCFLRSSLSTLASAWENSDSMSGGDAGAPCGAGIQRKLHLSVERDEWTVFHLYQVWLPCLDFWLRDDLCWRPPKCVVKGSSSQVSHASRRLVRLACPSESYVWKTRRCDVEDRSRSHTRQSWTFNPSTSRWSQHRRQILFHPSRWIPHLPAALFRVFSNSGTGECLRCNGSSRSHGKDCCSCINFVFFVGCFHVCMLIAGHPDHAAVLVRWVDASNWTYINVSNAEWLCDGSRQHEWMQNLLLFRAQTFEHRWLGRHSKKTQHCNMFVASASALKGIPWFIICDTVIYSGYVA